MAPTIHVLTTGGTIASTYTKGAATPTKRGRELIEAIPELEDVASLTVEEVCQRGSVAIDREIIARLGRYAEEAQATGADGVVVTHGTDTLEESAYFLDLALNLEIPVVFTGAQRGFDELSSDGPANLVMAIQAAGHDRLAGQRGVYVAFNDELHTARDVTKTHTSKLDTFRSPETGPVASKDYSGFRFHRRPGSRSSHIPCLEPIASVSMVKSGIEVDGAAVERAIDDSIDGIVVEATGLGNVAPKLGQAIQDALDAGLAVVLTSRCFTGAVAPKYGTPSGGKTLHDHGVIMGGDLPTHKARIKLMLALDTYDTMDDVRRAFEDT